MSKYTALLTTTAHPAIADGYTVRPAPDTRIYVDGVEVQPNRDGTVTVYAGQTIRAVHTRRARRSSARSV